jgi:hypothetical protein
MTPCRLVEMYRRVRGTYLHSSSEQNSVKVFCVRSYAEPLNRNADHLFLIPFQGQTEITKLKDRVKVKCIQWRHLVFCYLSIIIIVIGSTALGGPWPPLANVAIDLYPGHPTANFYNPVSLRLPLPCQSILISVGHVLVDLQGLSTIFF